jgi:hypothetical protein
MTVNGTCHFVNFTKACDYYRDQGNDELTPAQLEKLVREKIDEGEVVLGPPDLKPGQKMLLIDNNTRYGIETAD